MNALKVFLSLLICGSACQPAAHSAERDWLKIGNGLTVETVSKIEPADVWHSESKNTYRSQDGLVISFWPMDSESADRKNNLVAVGLIMVGLGDVAEKPVAMKLWAKKQLSFASEEARGYQERHGRAALFFYQRECADIKACRGKMIAVVFESTDNKVFINGKPAGVIEGP